MAAHVPVAPGYLQMLKQGARYYSGLEEVVHRNIEACKQLSHCLRTSYGPNGLNKLVINHLEKIFVTGDAALILRELVVEHPAAKMLVMATQAQEQEIGDGTNFVLILAGSLLENAEELLKLGLSVSEITEGYKVASNKALELLEDLSCSSLKDIRDVTEVAAATKPSLASKQYGYEDFLATLVAKSCVSAIPKSGEFSAESVRICKIIGASVEDSVMLEGMVFKRETEGTVNSVQDAKVAVYTCAFDSAKPETKGTVLLKSAGEFMDFRKGEEALVESHVRDIAEAGVNVVVVGAKIGDLALHYADKYKLMVVKMTSRNDLRRLCKALGATPLLSLIPPAEDELGSCSKVYLQEVGNTQVVIFKQNQECPMSTILLRGSTDRLLDNIEEAVNDAVSTYNTLIRDPRLVPGAGATEMQLAVKIADFGQSVPGLEQYAIHAYSKSLQSITRALADNSGTQTNPVMSKLFSLHQQGESSTGVSADGEGTDLIDASEAGILDPLLLKHWGIKLASEAAITVLGVDQIIIAKKSGGPKPRGENPNWDVPHDAIDN
ncbi:UNVERIFIED_CONTAM: hypothetical protein FKN15_025868 [Acipenser sinensis]